MNPGVGELVRPPPDGAVCVWELTNSFRLSISPTSLFSRAVSSQALSTALTPNAFPSVELEWEDAIKFLKKEALVLPSGTDKGYVLVRYQGLPLGFVKNLGNRANNLYPQEWRIRTGYIPEEIKLFLGR